MPYDLGADVPFYVVITAPRDRNGFNDSAVPWGNYGNIHSEQAQCELERETKNFKTECVLLDRSL